MEKKANETKARELTHVLARALQSREHHEESDYPKKSSCAALLVTIGEKNSQGIQALLQDGQAN